MNCNAVKELYCFHLYVTKLNPKMNYITLFFVGMIALYQVKADLVSTYHMYCKHRLHRYTEVSYLKLIWWSRKWKILKENLFLWVIVNYCLSLFSVFPSFKHLNQSSFV